MRRTVVSLYMGLLLAPMILFGAAGEARARPFRPGFIPNGSKFSCANCHVNPLGSGPRNAFGMAVEQLVTFNGLEEFWGPELAMMDSDGDGFTNGEELQDPTGVWFVGAPAPGDLSLVSLPGDPGSVPPAGPTPTPEPTPSATPTSSPTPTPSPTPIPTPTPVLPVAVDAGLRLVASDFDRPIFVGHAGDGSGRLFVVEQKGMIKIIDADGAVPSTPFLDINSLVVNLGSFGDERGLLGLAFHPGYAANGRFFVHYNDNAADSVLAEYRVSANNPDVADPNAVQIVLGPIDQPFANHNGGMIAFGPDGMLYMALGDGGSGGDPLNNAQTTTEGNLLGKILRIDVNRKDPGLNYGIPTDNPFAQTEGAASEIYAYGLRNAWRFSFDRSSGRLFAGDVGQNSIEEIDLIVNGGNYGWRLMEGSQCFNPSTGCDTGGLILPINEYSHALGCSVTGGYVYRGREYPNMNGLYIFGDFCDGTIWALQETAPNQWERTTLLESGFLIGSFGEDEAGEIYVVDSPAGTVYQITDTHAALVTSEDFASEGNAAGWQSAALGQATLEAVTATGATAGLCIDSPLEGANIGVWTSPRSAAIALVRNSVYRVRFAMTTDQLQGGEQVVWNILVENLDELGRINWGAERWFFANTGFANGVGNSGFDGLTEFEAWIVPNPVTTDAWNGLVDPADSPFTPANLDSAAFNVSFRVLDLDPIPGASTEDSGTLCLSSLTVDRFDLDNLTLDGGPIWGSEFAAPDGLSVLAISASGPNFVESTTVVDDAGATITIELDEPPAAEGIQGVGRAFIEYKNPAGQNANAQMYPVMWNDGELLRLTSEIRATSAVRVNPVDVIALGWQAATNELGGFDFSFRGAPGGIMDGAASPRDDSAANSTYTSFFYTHHGTDVDLGQLPDANRLRGVLDFFNRTDLAGGLDPGVLSDPFQIRSMAIHRIVYDEATLGPKPAE